jgi:hypothetical protein
MRKHMSLLIGAIIASALPVRAELLQADLSIFGMD